MGFLEWMIGFRPHPAEAETKSFDVIEALRAEASGDAGERVDTNRALECSTVLACTRVIAEGLAMVPCKVYRRDAKGGREEAADHPLNELLDRSPNEFQTTFEFRETLGFHAVLTGDAFAFVNRNANGQPIELLGYDPSTITVERNGFDRPRYFTKSGNRKVELPADNMWHFKGPSWNGYRGIDAVKAARAAIGLSLATEKFGSKLFKNGARPSGILTAEGGVNGMTPEQARLNKEMWEAAHAGADNAHKVAVLSGMTWQSISTNPDEAQFLETRKLQIEEICRFMRVLPIMVMHNENATSYASVEQLMLAHINHTLAPWFTRFEKSAERALLTEKERADGYQIRLNTRGLMRGSAQERATYYSIMRQNGLMTVNECRDAEDMPRIDDPVANQITPAANLYGPSKEKNNNERN